MLEGLVNLTTLNLAVNRVGDITPLEGLTALRTLNLSENLVSDLTPLSALNRTHTTYISRAMTLAMFLRSLIWKILSF